jgi:hypothetical protein
MLRLSLGLVLTFSLGSIACTAGATSPHENAGDEPSAESADAAASSWLAGSQWSFLQDKGYELDREELTFDADGTGEDSNVTIDLVTSYGAGDNTTKETFRWSATRTVLTLDATDYALVVTPNCREIQFRGKTLHGSSPNPCPFDIPALTHEERTLVGTWHFAGGYDASGTKSEGTLTFEADRNVSYSFTTYKYMTEDAKNSRDVRGYLTTGTHGMQAVDPLGKDIGLTVEFHGSELMVCMIECDTLKKQ